MEAELGSPLQDTAGLPHEVVRVREVADVETLQALSDPLRLNILRTLMAGDRRVMTVKELARELDLAPTRLYRHVKQLLMAGLIEVAETRLVSGIVEYRYRSSQHDIVLGPGLLDRPDHTDIVGTVAAVLDSYRGRLIAALAADSDAEVPFVASIGTRLSHERAAELRRRLKDLVAEYDEDIMAPGDVEVDLLVGLRLSDTA